MIKACVATSVVVAVSLLAGAGCTPTPSEQTPQFQEIKASLARSEDKVRQLEADNQKSEKAREDAESKLGEVTRTRDNLDDQVQKLTTARSSLEAKVNDLGKARVALETRVNELQKTVDNLTKARDAALEEARTAQGTVAGLNDKVKVQNQQITDLQEQLKMIRATLGQLQQKLQ